MNGVNKIGILSLIKTLTKRVYSVVGMVFVFSSLWLALCPIATFAATTDAMNAGIGESATWNNPGYVAARDLSYASINLSSGTTTEYLKGKNYDFSTIPNGARIDKVTVIIRRLAINSIQDNGVYLVDKQGTTVGPNKAVKTLTWTTNASSIYYTWTAAELSAANLTFADIKDPNFGVVLSAKSGNSNSTAYVDSMQITVDYTPDITAPSISSITGNTTSWQNTDITLTVNAADVANGTDPISGIATSEGYSFDNGVTWQDSNQKVFDSNQTINIKVKDSAGNISNATSVVIDKIDKIAPALTPSQNPTEATDGKVTITPNAIDDNGIDEASYKYAPGNENAAYFATEGTPFAATFDVSTNGTYTIYLKDKAGNENVATITVSNISYTVKFYNDLGQTISTQPIIQGENAVAPTNPSKLNYMFMGWDKTFTNVQSNLDIHPRFIPVTYTLTVEGGTGSGTYNASSNVFAKLTAIVPTGQKFAGWKDDTGSIISYYSTYNFIITSNKKLTATFNDISTAAIPVISIDKSVIELNVNDSYGKMYFTSTMALPIPAGYQLIECGVVVSKTISTDLTKDNALIILKSTSQNSAGQFQSIFNVTYGNTLYARSYIIYKNTVTGDKFTKYSGNTITATMIKQ